MSAETPTSTPAPVRVGVMLEEVQLADITGIDILGNLSKDFVDAVCAVSPGHKVFAPLSIPFEFFYIATTLDAATVTPGLRYVPTVTYDTCPRDLDIVIIGGPFPGHRPPQADKFMREAWESVRVWMTTCIGSLWLAHSGVLEGKKVTTNRMFLPAARQIYPGIEWVDQRWIVQEKEYDGKRGGGKGELWTAGGAGCGIDMIAHFALQNYDELFVRVFSLDSLEFDPEQSHTQFYKHQPYQYPDYLPTLSNKYGE